MSSSTLFYLALLQYVGCAHRDFSSVSKDATSVKDLWTVTYEERLRVPDFSPPSHQPAHFALLRLGIASSTNTATTR